MSEGRRMVRPRKWRRWWRCMWDRVCEITPEAKALEGPCGGQKEREAHLFLIHSSATRLEEIGRICAGLSQFHVH